jgi:hypothetical protein
VTPLGAVIGAGLPLPPDTLLEEVLPPLFFLLPIILLFIEHCKNNNKTQKLQTS